MDMISAVGSIMQAIVSLVAIAAAWHIGKTQNKISDRQLVMMEKQNSFEKMKFTHENIYKELQYNTEQLLDCVTNMRGSLDCFDENIMTLSIYGELDKARRLYLNFLNHYNNKKDFLCFNDEIDNYVLKISKAISDFLLLKAKIPSMKNGTSAECAEWEHDFYEKQYQISLLKQECIKTFDKVFPK